MLFLTKHESDLIVLSYPYKFMSCYLYIHNNNYKLQNLFPTTGATNPATTGTVSTVPNFFDQDDFFIILFRIWKWVSSSILNSKFNSEAYFSHSSTFASIWCKGQKATTFNCHFLCGWYNAITSYTNLICKSNALFIFVVCRRVSLSGEAAR